MPPGLAATPAAPRAGDVVEGEQVPSGTSVWAAGTGRVRASISPQVGWSRSSQSMSCTGMVGECGVFEVLLGSPLVVGRAGMGEELADFLRARAENLGRVTWRDD